MIKYNLICKCGETFESWFSGSVEFDSLRKKKLLKCIYCESLYVKKDLMAPSLNRKSNKALKRNKLEKNIKKQLIEFRKYIAKNCKDVGSSLYFNAFVNTFFTSKGSSLNISVKTNEILFISS